MFVNSHSVVLRVFHLVTHSIFRVFDVIPLFSAIRYHLLVMTREPMIDRWNNVSVSPHSRIVGEVRGLYWTCVVVLYSPTKHGWAFNESAFTRKRDCRRTNE